MSEHLQEIIILPTNTSPETLDDLKKWSEKYHGISPWIQLDISDGDFVPALSWPYRDETQWKELQDMGNHTTQLPDVTTTNYEVHLMVRKPLEVGIELAKAGVKRIIAHREVFLSPQDYFETAEKWKKAGAQEVGLAILMDTSLEQYEAFVPACDVVMLMSIPRLGFQGAPFDERVYEKIAALHRAHPALPIAIDGGVSKSNIAQLKSNGATRFGVGSAISKADNPQEAYHQLLELCRVY